MMLVAALVVTVGAVRKVKSPVLVAVPAGLVTVTLPVAPAPTVAVICVAESTEYTLAAVPPKATAVVSVR
jgi:hypothetical protein